MSETIYTGYDFYIDGLRLPFAPSSVKTSIGANNSTVTLLNNQEVNILKSPKLTDISFTARIPQQQFPYAHDYQPAVTYLNKFESLILNKKPCELVIVRVNANGSSNTSSIATTNRKNATTLQVSYNTKMTVTLESYDIEEDADEGFDLLVGLDFKQYVPYGTKTLINGQVVNNNVVGSSTNSVLYTVLDGDTLAIIDRKFYKTPTPLKNISYVQALYRANKNAIEAAARANGQESSSNGYFLYPGTVLLIPPISGEGSIGTW